MYAGDEKLCILSRFNEAFQHEVTHLGFKKAQNPIFGAANFFEAFHFVFSIEIQSFSHPELLTLHKA